MKYLEILVKENIYNLKKYLLFILTILALTSCGVSTPSLTDEKPFIVNEIYARQNGDCIYVGQNFSNMGGELFASKPQIIAKKGLYNIGDTIKLNKR